MSCQFLGNVLIISLRIPHDMLGDGEPRSSSEPNGCLGSFFSVSRDRRARPNLRATRKEPGRSRTLPTKSLLSEEDSP
jgi:hypothetical protein